MLSQKNKYTYRNNFTLFTAWTKYFLQRNLEKIVASSMTKLTKNGLNFGVIETVYRCRYLISKRSVFPWSSKAKINARGVSKGNNQSTYLNNIFYCNNSFKTIRILK